MVKSITQSIYAVISFMTFYFVRDHGTRKRKAEEPHVEMDTSIGKRCW